jgi:hypothetical protein
MRDPVRVSTISIGAIKDALVPLRRSLGAVLAAAGAGTLADFATGVALTGCAAVGCKQDKSATATPYPSSRLCTRATSPICSRFAAPALGS